MMTKMTVRTLCLLAHMIYTGPGSGSRSLPGSGTLPGALSASLGPQAVLRALLQDHHLRPTSPTQELMHRKLVRVCFDRAGTSNADPADANVTWGDPVSVAMSQWYVKYKAASKQTVGASVSRQHKTQQPFQTGSYSACHCYDVRVRRSAACLTIWPVLQIKTECQIGPVRVMCAPLWLHEQRWT